MMFTPHSFLKCKAFLLALLIVTSCASNRELQKVIEKDSWSTQKIHSSVEWKSYHFKDLFGSKQYINILDINLADSTLRVGIAYHDSILQPTSVMVANVNAIAATNGNFFHTEKGGSVCYFKLDDKLLDTSRTDLNETLFLPWLDEGAICINKNNVLSINRKPPNGWQTLDTIPTILSSGPLLVFDGDTLPQVRHSFNDSRYSRTGIGITSKKHLLLITVDGNSIQSAGMTMYEFATLFKKLGCPVALNLDGGGSTTMWVKGQPDNGIVSHPTDNKKFDHFGERKVANYIFIQLK